MSNEPLRRKNLLSFLSLLLIAFTALAANVAHATSDIMAANKAPACSSCHTQGLFSKAEGRAGLAAYLAAQTPTCVAPQVLQGNVCVTPPPPTCVAPQVLQGNVCVTPPPPTCIAPEVLQGNVCVLPQPPTCVAPEVLQGNVCVLPQPPTCIAPEVLQGNVCVLPQPPTCIAPEVLQGNVCVLPQPPTCVAPEVLQGNVCVTPPPTACGNVDAFNDDEHHQEDGDRDDDRNRDRDRDDDSDKFKKAKIVPTLTAPDNVSVHAGETLIFAVTAFDCASRPLAIVAEHLPNGAVLENTVDPLLQMTKGVITWTPDVGVSARTLEIELKVVADDGVGKPVESEDQAVIINVLPATPALPLIQNGPVQSNTVVSAGYRSKSKQLTVAGQLLWDRSSAKSERLNFAKNQKVVVSDSATGMPLGAAAIKSSGKWKTAIRVDANTALCSIDVEAGGVRVTQSVNGANCR